MPTLAVRYADPCLATNANEVYKGPASHPIRDRDIQSLEVLAQDFGKCKIGSRVGACTDRQAVNLDGREDFGNAVGNAVQPHRWNVVCLSVRDRPKPQSAGYSS